MRQNEDILPSYFIGEYENHNMVIRTINLPISYLYKFTAYKIILLTSNTVVITKYLFLFMGCVHKYVNILNYTYYCFSIYLHKIGILLVVY